MKICVWNRVCLNICLVYFRMVGVMNLIKKECYNDELKWGCVNYVMS